jgi:hypothetical protein
VVAIRCRITLEPEQAVTVNIVTGIGETRAAAVALAKSGRKPSDIMTEAAFRNAYTVLQAIGGSTNAVIHFTAVAARLGYASFGPAWYIQPATGLAAAFTHTACAPSPSLPPPSPSLPSPPPAPSPP